MKDLQHRGGSSRRLFRLAPLLLVALLPSCMTIQLWHTGSESGGFFAEQQPATTGALLVDASADHLMVRDPGGLATLELASVGHASEFARALLVHPDVFEVQSVVFVGHLDPRDRKSSLGELVVTGKVRGDLHTLNASGTVGGVASVRRRGEVPEHTSTWSLSSTEMGALRKPVVFEVPVGLSLTLQELKPRTTSWPWRVVQVVLTPPALVADVVVTPVILVWFFFNPPRFIF